MVRLDRPELRGQLESGVHRAPPGHSGRLERRVSRVRGVLLDHWDRQVVREDLDRVDLAALTEMPEIPEIQELSVSLSFSFTRSLIDRLDWSDDQ